MEEIQEEVIVASEPKEWGFTMAEGDRGLFDTTLANSMKPVELVLDRLLEYVVESTGLVHLPKVKGLAAELAKAFREGPVVSVGRLQLDIVDYYGERRKVAGRAINKFIKDHSESYPQLHTFVGVQQVKQIRPVSKVATEVVMHTDTGRLVYVESLVKLCAEYITCGMLIDEGKAAIDGIADSLVSYRECKAFRFMIGNGCWSPCAWYDLEKLGKDGINRLGAEVK